MKFHKTEIPEVILISPEVFGDDRGFFLETYRENMYFDAGINYKFVQDNHSGSSQGILRGLHFQSQHSQGKIVRVVKGEIFDVAVDIRRESPTFGKWVGAHLSDENKNQLWIPPKFAHGFYVISSWAEVCYKATDYYAPDHEKSIVWNDPDININWPLVNGQSPILSQKDKAGISLKTYKSNE
jgi:dTDP-4-dehydrorhamnose 3,5-epimerase